MAGKECGSRRVPPAIGVRHPVIHREVRESSVCDFGRARETGRRRRCLLLVNCAAVFGPLFFHRCNRPGASETQRKGLNQVYVS